MAMYLVVAATHLLLGFPLVIDNPFWDLAIFSRDGFFPFFFLGFWRDPTSFVRGPRSEGGECHRYTLWIYRVWRGLCPVCTLDPGSPVPYVNLA